MNQTYPKIAIIISHYNTPKYLRTCIDGILKQTYQNIEIGPGLGDNEKTISAVEDIIVKLQIPTVLDADAITVLKKISRYPLPQSIVITPHGNEFKNLVDREIYVQKEDTRSIILLRSISMDLHINVLLKGPTDYVASDEGVVETNNTGNAGMTIGGSGDVLSGVVACFLAQGMESFDAARCAAYYVGKAGDYMYKKKGNGFSSSDIAFALPYVMK